MSTTNPILAIENQYGQSIWMDNLSRDLIKSGELKQSVAEKVSVGLLPILLSLKKRSLVIKLTIQQLKLELKLISQFKKFTKI